MTKMVTGLTLGVIAWMIGTFIEIFFVKLGCYALSIGNASNISILDLLCYSGYKFVALTVCLLVRMCLNFSWWPAGQAAAASNSGRAATGGAGIVSWLVFFYVIGALTVFLLRSLRHFVVASGDDDSTMAANEQGNFTRQANGTWNAELQPLADPSYGQVHSAAASAMLGKKRIHFLLGVSFLQFVSSFLLLKWT